uniref:Uncharacterized protein n=1 Tax=Parascaris equorum TaxID=6256 RepID=A0A914SIG7_PAREQ
MEKQMSWSIYLRISSSPVTDQAVSNMKEFDVVVKTTLGNRDGGIRLLFSAETDCLDSGYIGIRIESATESFHGSGI